MKSALQRLESGQINGDTIRAALEETTAAFIENVKGTRASRFDPNARSFEAFSLGTEGRAGAHLLDPVEATQLDAALAEVTERHHGLDRGSRLGVRELGQDVDLMHVYAVRRTSTPQSYRAAYDNPYGRAVAVWKRRLEHICTIDLRAVAGFEPAWFSDNPSLREVRRREWQDRQRQRPEGARRG